MTMKHHPRCVDAPDEVCVCPKGWPRKAVDAGVSAWLSEVGRKGGVVKSERKAASSRVNGGKRR